jgi:hypothetical protein
LPLGYTNHDLGIIYVQLPISNESIIILNPKWLGKLFGVLVQHRIMKGYNNEYSKSLAPNGIVSSNDFSKLASYIPELKNADKELHLSLLSILKKLELCIEVRENEFLFPSMIENDKRNNIILDRSLHNMKTKSFRIELSFMPVSFFSHLFVYLFQQCNDKFELENGWSNGAFFR